MQRIRSLDGIRGIAIGLVILWHYVVLRTPGAHAWGGLTWTGVDLFFVLSGFLIGGILLDKPSFSSFYIRRTTRIVPLYLVWLAITALLFVPSLPLAPFLVYAQNFWMAARNTMGDGNTGITWSLAIEEQFYLTLPFAMVWISERTLKSVIVAGICAAPLLRVAIYFAFPHHRMACFVLMPCRADSLLAGVGCATLFRERPSWLTGSRLRSAVLVFAIGAVALEAYNPWMLGFPMISAGITWMALFYATVILTAVFQPAGLLARLASWPLLRNLGIIAYGVYLFHEPILLALGRPLVAFVVTLAICYLSWTYFEQPIVEWGRKYRYQ